METLKKMMTATKGKLLQLFGGLIMEQKDEDGDGKYLWVVSLGRIAFWTVFIHVMYVFNTEGKVLSAEELSVFYALLGYQGVKLGKDALTETASAWKSGGPST